MTKPRYELLIEALPDADGVSVEVRLRRALKHLLRACGLRCVSARLVKNEPPQPAGDVPAPPTLEKPC